MKRFLIVAVAGLCGLMFCCLGPALLAVVASSAGTLAASTAWPTDQASQVPGPVLLRNPTADVKGRIAPVLAYALAQVGDPYVWGAAGPNAFDCSGLTMAAYRRIGVQLPHRSDRQVRFGRAVSASRRAVRAGDLIFLRGGVPVHNYGHVGIALDANRWVVAPHSGQDVQVGEIPYQRVQAVRRLVVNP